MLNQIKRRANYPMVVLIIAFVNILWGFEVIGITPQIKTYVDLVGFSKYSNDLQVFNHMDIIQTTSFYAGIAGMLLGGYLADRVGRRLTLQLSNGLFFLTVCLFLFTYTIKLDIISLSLMKMAASSIIITSVCLLAELSPTNVRGKSIGMVKLFGAAGIMISYACNYFIPYFFKDLVALRYFILLLVSGSSCVLLFFVPESPRWLVQVKNDKPKAQAVLETVFKTTAAENPEQQLILSQTASPWRFSLALIRPPILRTSILVCVATFLVMATGIGGLISRAPDLFHAAGIHGQERLLFLSLLLILTFVAGVFISLFLIDRIGPRKLIMLGLGSMVVTYLVLSMASNLSLGNLLEYLVLLTRPFIFIFFYALGCSVVVTLILTLYFPTALRGRAIAMSSVIVIVMYVLSTRFFAMIEESLGLNGVYWISTLMGLLLLILCSEILPDRKSVVLEDLKLS
jgi:MFS family permease